ncbi:sugar kinase [Bifidobacterium asteroides]|uniref:sugar kinase n=1 Tax=Bifidobacterium asteroides TaxID=1684 RepID=UPI0018DD07D6|nr:sugar kinase [Bifidobacterium asteroides]MBH9984022.1 sugar kinase [Bifidobacterium asteroides]
MSSMDSRRQGNPLPVVGVDVGGTKTRIDTLFSRHRQSLTLASDSWRRNSDTVLPHDMSRLAELVQAQAAKRRPGPAVLCLGLHGADTPQQLNLATTALTEQLPGWRIRVVNDAELLGPTAGIRQALNLVVGTGMVVVGRDTSGNLVRADGYGYGWLLGDYGSAPALVREAVREILNRGVVAGTEAVMEDPLTQDLLEHFTVRDINQLALAFGSSADEQAWGRLAPLFFRSLQKGSAIADEILDQAVTRIGLAVKAVIHAGACGRQVVAAGGVITHQPIMAHRLSGVLASLTGGPVGLRLLEDPPVTGALAMASRLQSDTGQTTSTDETIIMPINKKGTES